MIKNNSYYLNSRYDCVVIWGHGFNFLEEILNELRLINSFKIIKIIKQTNVNIKKLVNKIYSYDYAPKYHLKSKIHYLKFTPPQVFFIFIKNNDPQEDYYGEKKFRHIESRTMRNFKNKIRQKFNPKINEKIPSNDHIIHTTDSEAQTEHLLYLLGFKNGIQSLINNDKILPTPHYLNEPAKFSIQFVPLDNIYCNNVVLVNNSAYIKKMPIYDSVQYKFFNDKRIYEKYLSDYRGTFLTQDYNLSSYSKLIQNLNYLKGKFQKNFITVQTNLKNELFILDGLHRASILLKRGEKKIKVCIYET